MTSGNQRLLVKLRRTGAAPFAAAGKRKVAGVGITLEPLFEAPSPPAGFGAAGERHDWALAHLDGGLADHSWDTAHRSIEAGFGAAGGVLFVEPDLEQSWQPAPGGQPFSAVAAPSGPRGQNPKLPVGPTPAAPADNWHLLPGFSGLAGARAAAGLGAGVTIVHLDTGYDPGHLSLPQRLDLQRQRNFVEGGKDAADAAPVSLNPLINRGHGTGTLGILAGRQPGGGHLGGAPLATVVPCRIANSVVHFWTSGVAQGIDYAREIGADVLSMSMGGVASAAWADVVNAAYESGLTLVTAAGNNFWGVPTRFTVFPARFQRVIAACGVMANKHPYFHLPFGVMQGNWGPANKAATAIAAFTPNMPWARLGGSDVIDMDGQGTSAATPQVAAAAALWLAKHGARYPKDWRRVEAVRQALFDSASKEGKVEPGDAPEELFGHGLLKAKDALAIIPAAATLTRTPEDSASFAFLRALTGLGVTGAAGREAMFRLELTQLAQSSRALEQAMPDPDAEPRRISAAEQRRFFDAVLAEGNCSRSLRSHLEQRLTLRPTAIPKLAPPRHRAGKLRSAPGTASPQVVTRRAKEIPPPSRRLRIFAVDPSLGPALSTSLLNETTVEVPWERSATSSNTLQPGPVGEYLEVVDLDPASGIAYAPVDLNDELLLAQDGLPPSEGNPQFHQQMTYAVAMTTIGHFETALGRAALWAPHRPQGRDHYVPRLRIYPHALRGANAYYSPEKKALLFGYFPTGQQAPGAEGSLIFTCLSHDVIAHETTHALLDGLHRRLQEPSNPDVHAFHEAFADLVAILQHFTFPALLEHELQLSAGDLSIARRLADLAKQFGEGMGRSSALRNAIDPVDRKAQYRDDLEPHALGAILVAAVFDAFLAVYRRRSADLLRMAEAGGLLRAGALTADFVDRLAHEAVDTAKYLLTICIRALDYLPPVDVTFPEYLRALITADADLVPEDKHGYRAALLEAFRARGIRLKDVRTYSVESVRWKEPPDQIPGLAQLIGSLNLSWERDSDRELAFREIPENCVLLHRWLATNLSPSLARQLGLDLSLKKFEVHSVRPARRLAPDGSFQTDLVAVITQQRLIPGTKTNFRGGCTLIIDVRKGRERIRYAIAKNINSERRQKEQLEWLGQQGTGLSALYFGSHCAREPFAVSHLGY